MTAVVHLVRVGEPIDSLRRFLDSYRSHPAGVEHLLVLLFKGFDGDDVALAPYRELARDLPHTELQLSDEGFDLTAYRSSAALLQARRYCFLNSHSRILADRWLGLLDRALNLSGVGLAGASGSWASQGSLARYLHRLPSPYSNVFDDRGSLTLALEALERLQSGKGADVAPEEPGRRFASASVRLWASLRNVPHALRIFAAFEQFPAYHIRTNAFTIEHDLLMSMTGFALEEKLHAHVLESGHGSLTSQVEDRGLRAVVVDRFGGVHERSDWAVSETFWQGAQRGLLIADNQTDSYQQGDHARRLLLSRYAWGASAAPA